MTTTQVKKTRIIKDAPLFDELIERHNKISSAIADQKKVLEAIEADLMAELKARNIKEIANDSTIVRIHETGNTPTWKQDECINATRTLARALERDALELLGEAFALKPREKTAEALGYDIKSLVKSRSKVSEKLKFEAKSA